MIDHRSEKGRGLFGNLPQTRIHPQLLSGLDGLDQLPTDPSDQAHRDQCGSALDQFIGGRDR